MAMRLKKPEVGGAAAAVEVPAVTTQQAVGRAFDEYVNRYIRDYCGAPPQEEIEALNGYYQRQPRTLDPPERLERALTQYRSTIEAQQRLGESVGTPALFEYVDFLAGPAREGLTSVQRAGTDWLVQRGQIAFNSEVYAERVREVFSGARASVLSAIQRLTSHEVNEMNVDISRLAAYDTDILSDLQARLSEVLQNQRIPVRVSVPARSTRNLRFELTEALRPGETREVRFPTPRRTR